MSAPEPMSPLARCLRPGISGAAGPTTPLLLSQHPAEIVQVIARQRSAEIVKAALADALRLDLPAPGYATAGSQATAIWIAPDTWLVMRSRSEDADLLSTIRSACGGAAALVDQSCGKTVLRLSGSRAPDVLAKGCRIDLHPRVFGPGRAAATPIAHVHVILRQVDASPTFELLVPSTLAEHVFEWLCISAAEFGCEVR